jgi:hypothetical protein
VAFGRNEFTLNKRQKDGATLREHLESVARQSGKIPEELITLELPSTMVHLWGIFVDLDGGRTMHAAGPNPLSWADMLAWTKLTGQYITGSEAQALRALDRAFLNVHNS